MIPNDQNVHQKRFYPNVNAVAPNAVAPSYDNNNRDNQAQAISLNELKSRQPNEAELNTYAKWFYSEHNSPNEKEVLKSPPLKSLPKSQRNDDVNLSKNDEEHTGYGCCDYMLIGLSYVIGFIFLPIFIVLSIKIIKEYERAVIMRLGRIASGGAKGPGLFWVLPCTDTIQVVDLRTLTFNIPPQEILTKDSVTVAVDGVCYFRTYNPVVAVTKTENAANATR